MELDVTKIAGKAIARVMVLLIGQREKGLAKYGVPVEDAPLSSAEWIKHAQEEAADFLVYSVRIAETIEEEKRQAVAEFIGRVNIILDDPNMRSFDLKIAALEELVDGYTPVTGLQMYAQQSQLQEFVSTEANLLTLSRSRAFPFNTPIKVIG